MAAEFVEKGHCCGRTKNQLLAKREVLGIYSVLHQLWRCLVRSLGNQSNGDATRFLW